MRRKIVPDNGKVHGSRGANAAMIEAIVAGVTSEGMSWVICPPHVYLHDTWRVLRGGSVALGAQDLCAEAVGAYTGEVSGAMLKDVGCTYALVGHSERRTLFGESSALVARKFAAALSAGLIPILCVGEQLSDREAGRTEGIVGSQLEAVTQLSGVQALGGAVIAYEPVWAIGTGRTATPEQAQGVHAFIRQRVAAEDAKIAAGLRIPYCGSGKGGKGRGIIATPPVDGGAVRGRPPQGQ